MTKKQVNNMEVKKNNRNRIFRYICKCDKTSNPEISYELKMSLPTVTQNTKELMERGLIAEVGEFQSTGGRRAKAFSVVADSKLAVGLDITKNHVGLLLTNLTGKILKHDIFHYPYSAEDDYYREINKRLESFLDESVKEREKNPWNWNFISWNCEFRERSGFLFPYVRIESITSCYSKSFLFL